MAEMRTVVFVCEHGAAKSVIAAALLERLAIERGDPVRALARGTEPDRHISAAVAARLLEEGIDVRGWQPRQLTQADLAPADRIVSFGPDLSSFLTAEGAPFERWHDVPPASEEFNAARAAILRRLPSLFDAGSPPARPAPSGRSQSLRSR
jgi:arsenate reductase